jgi:hypothetical protein
MFRSYDHHQAEKYIELRRRIKTHIIRYHTRNRMQTPKIKFVKLERLLIFTEGLSCIKLAA